MNYKKFKFSFITTIEEVFKRKKKLK